MFFKGFFNKRINSLIDSWPPKSPRASAIPKTGSGNL